MSPLMSPPINDLPPALVPPYGGGQISLMCKRPRENPEINELHNNEPHIKKILLSGGCCDYISAGMFVLLVTVLMLI